jgi:transposase
MSKAEYAKLVAILQESMRSLERTIEGLREDLARRDAEISELRRMLFGQRRERIKPIEREVTKRSVDPQAKKAAANAKRKATADAQAALPEVTVEYPIVPEDESCAACGGAFRPLGEGEVSYEYEYIPGRIVRRRNVRARKVCACGACIVVAPARPRVADGVKYGPGFHAHVVIAKCADSMPLHRLAQSLRRAGVPISATSLGDIFHRVAELLRPLAHLVMRDVAACGYVNADETPVRVMAKGKTRRAYAWTFLGDGQVAYRYSPSRSGELPSRLLAGHGGFLQVDAYSGYNAVFTPTGWTRVGCLAHVRRYFFEAQATAPEAAQEAMERILAIYQVEHEAAARGICGEKEHLTLRQGRSAPLMQELHDWLKEQRGLHRPKSPMGKAITYALNGWKNLLIFLEDPRLSLDNNASERALRIVALGRKNFLFVGNNEAGENLAVLQTIIGCCDLAEVNPQKYLEDVLLRIQTHPAVDAAQLLPRAWKHRFAKN